MTRSRQSLLFALIVSLAACSGSGGSASTPPQPPAANMPPGVQIDPVNTVSEGISGVAFTFTSTDGDSDARTHTLSGPDAALFDLSAPRYSGTQADIDLIFREALDFERPGDADGDGRYAVTVTVSDGVDSVVVDSEIVVGDVRWDFDFVDLHTGLNQPLQALRVTDDASTALAGGIFLIEKTGRFLLIPPGQAAGVAAPDLVLDLSADVSTTGERGLLGFALSPDFATDGTVYFNLTNTAGDTEIRRYRMFSGREDLLDPSTEELILAIDQPRSNHNAGWLGFAPDGTLLIPMGDGGGSNDPDDLAQDPTSLLGKVLRIDVSGDDFPADAQRNYAIPAGNAFPNGVGGAPEIFALGLRNPYRADFDRRTNALYIADVGQGAREEISRLSLDAPGTNFGWPLFEGTAPNTGTDPAGLTPPIAEYAHGASGASITGGVVIGEYGGDGGEIRYISADFITGIVSLVKLELLADGETVGPTAFETDTPFDALDLLSSAAIPRITSFSRGPEGTVYATVIDGRILVAEPASGP